MVDNFKVGDRTSTSDDSPAEDCKTVINIGKIEITNDFGDKVTCWVEYCGEGYYHVKFHKVKRQVDIKFENGKLIIIPFQNGEAYEEKFRVGDRVITRTGEEAVILSPKGQLGAGKYLADRYKNGHSYPVQAWLSENDLTLKILPAENFKVGDQVIITAQEYNGCQGKILAIKPDGRYSIWVTQPKAQFRRYYQKGDFQLCSQQDTLPGGRFKVGDRFYHSSRECDCEIIETKFTRKESPYLLRWDFTPYNPSWTHFKIVERLQYLGNSQSVDEVITQSSPGSIVEKCCKDEVENQPQVSETESSDRIIPESIADELIGSKDVAPKFRDFLIEFLYESYGLKGSTLPPDLTCFVNAQANTYSYQGKSEVNNIAGDVQLCPVRASKGKIREIIPDCKHLNFGESRVLFDSGAFPEVIAGCRVTPEKSLERQLWAINSLPKFKDAWIVSYDRLIDEKHVNGTRVKQRWSVEEGESAVRETVEAAKFLDSQRHLLEGYTLVQSCQGVDAEQYLRCVNQVLPYCRPGDVVGLGGWCILGRQPSYLQTFWETINLVIPAIASAGITKIHIFGVTWYKPRKNQPLPPLQPLLWVCDQYGIALSTDGRSPISNALWKDSSRAGATFSYWRHNLAWVKAEFATLRSSSLYQSPPGFAVEKCYKDEMQLRESDLIAAIRDFLDKCDRPQITGDVAEAVNCNIDTAYDILVAGREEGLFDNPKFGHWTLNRASNQEMDDAEFLEDLAPWQEADFGEVPHLSDGNQLTIFFDDSQEPPDPDDFGSLKEYEEASRTWTESHDLLDNRTESTFLSEPDICKDLRLNSILQDNRNGTVVRVGRSGFSVEWDGWVQMPYSFSQIEKLQLTKIEEEEQCSQPDTYIVAAAETQKEQSLPDTDHSGESTTIPTPAPSSEKGSQASVATNTTPENSPTNSFSVSLSQTVSFGEALVQIFPWLVNEPALMELAASCFLKESDSFASNVHHHFCLKTSRAFLAQTKQLPSPSSSKRLQNWGMWAVGKNLTPTGMFLKTESGFTVWALTADVRATQPKPYKKSLHEVLNGSPVNEFTGEGIDEAFAIRASTPKQGKGNKSHPNTFVKVGAKIYQGKTVEVDESPTVCGAGRGHYPPQNRDKGASFAIVYRAADGDRVYPADLGGDAPTLRSLANTGGNHQSGSGAYKVREIDGEQTIERPITPTEAEMLMGWEVGSTAVGIDAEGYEISISNTQRIKTLGNGIVPAEITNILENLKPILKRKLESEISSPLKVAYWQLRRIGKTHQEAKQILGVTP
jgi:hypothetical protein